MAIIDPLFSILDCRECPLLPAYSVWFVCSNYMP